MFQIPKEPCCPTLLSNGIALKAYEPNPTNSTDTNPEKGIIKWVIFSKVGRKKI